MDQIAQVVLKRRRKISVGSIHRFLEQQGLLKKNSGYDHLKALQNSLDSGCQQRIGGLRISIRPPASSFGSSAESEDGKTLKS